MSLCRRCDKELSVQCCFQVLSKFL